MNRSKIEWCDHTWNPITGCRHNCEYCYARRMTSRFSGDVRLNMMATGDYRTQPSADDSKNVFILDKPMLNETNKPLVYPFGFEPTLHRYRFGTIDGLKMGNNIFVGAMADVFGTWVPDDWINEIISICLSKPQHNWLFLTKNPGRYCKINIPEERLNMWYGTTVTREGEVDRINDLPYYSKTFVSIEPILEDLAPERHNDFFCMVDWIVIGAETGKNRNKVVPRYEWIKNLVLVADTLGIPVFMKESLVDIVGEKNMRRDFPPELQRKVVSAKMHNKLYDYCCKCRAQLKKNEMITLLGRSARGEQPKQFGFMCMECFKNFCKDNNLEVPKFKIMEEEVNGKDNDGE